MNAPSRTPFTDNSYIITEQRHEYQAEDRG
jgi:hypothetical protein